MVPPFLSTSLFPIRTPWAPKHPLHPTLLRLPPSSTPSTAVLLHHAGADTPTPPSITRDRPLSSTASDRDPVLSLHPHRRPPCRRLSYDRLVHRAPPPPSTLLDLLPRCRQPSLPQHRQTLSRCVHGAAPEAVLFRICSTYLSQQENRSPLLYSDFLSWLRSCLCPVCTFRSAMACSTLYSQCLWFSPFIFHSS